MTTKAPAYQRYPKDYMSDSNVLRMTFEQRGIYDWLLDSCWLEDGIPADLGEIAGICGLTRAKMAKAWERVSKCFVPHPRKPGWLTNGRLEQERQAQAEFRDKMESAGRKGAATRWGGHSQANGRATSQATVRPMASDSSAVRSLQSAVCNTPPGGGVTRAPAELASPEGPTANGHGAPHDLDGYQPTEAQRARAAELHVELEPCLRKWRASRKQLVATMDFPNDLAADFDGWLEREPAFASNGASDGRRPVLETLPTPAWSQPPPEPEPEIDPEQRAEVARLARETVAALAAPAPRPTRRGEPMPPPIERDAGVVAARVQERDRQLAAAKRLTRRGPKS